MREQEFQTFLLRGWLNVTLITAYEKLERMLNQINSFVKMLKNGLMPQVY